MGKHVQCTFVFGENFYVDELVLLSYLVNECLFETEV